MKRWFRILALVFAGVVAVLWLDTSEASAQEEPAETRIVVLEVAGGGEDVLQQELSDIEGVRVEGQSWFLEQMEEQEVSPKGIMNRPGELSSFMGTVGVDYILFFTSAGEEEYTAHVIGSSGEEIHSFPVSRSPEGISESVAASVRGELEREVFAVAEEAPEVAADEDGDELEKPAEPQDEEALEDDSGASWATFLAAARIFKRDHTIAGRNGAVLNYTSSLYPGFETGAELYVGDFIADALRDVGTHLSYGMGFDSVEVATDADSTESLPISHIEAEFGLVYRVWGVPVGDESSADGFDRDDVDLRLRLYVRHARFTLEENASLPDIVRTSAVLGASFALPFALDDLKLEGGVDLIPFSAWGASDDLFGESSSTYGFAAMLGLRYRLTTRLDAIAGWDFRLLKTSFDGIGRLEYVEAEAFELVQGATLGVLYHY